MKKILKLTLALIVVLTLNFSLFTTVTFADASSSVAFSKKDISVGDSVTVTVRVSQKAMYAVDIKVNYNEEVLTFVSGADGGAGVVSIVKELSGENSKSFALEFKAKKAGTCNISVDGTVGAGMPSKLVQIAGCSANLSVKDVSLSSNAKLKSLTVSSGSLSPKFSPNVTEYKINVKKSVTECKVYATSAETDATVSVDGSTQLKVGENKRVITVTAPSGNTKKYTLTIVRSDVDEEEEPETDLFAMVDGVSYAILKDISKLTLPDGFNVSKRVYNEETVSVAVDEGENFELFYLKAEKTPAAPYLFDEDLNSFKKVVIINQLSKTYIVAEPPEFNVPNGFEASTVTIGGSAVDCVVNFDPAYDGMHYIYCFTGGEFNTYRYDSKENVLQRSVEFKFNQEAVVETETEQTEKENVIKRFKKMPKTVKTIVVCVIIAFIALIALVVLLIIKIINRSKFVDYDIDDYDEDFDVIEINDNDSKV